MRGSFGPIRYKCVFIAIDKIHINSYNSKNIKEPDTGIGIK